MRISLISVMLISAFAVPLHAEEQPNHAINICAVAISVMNMYVVNYEYLLDYKHGLDVRLEYNPMSSDEIDANGVAAVLDYRWHLSPAMESLFAGPYARYRYVDGSGDVSGTDFDFNVSEVNLGVNVGYRWINDATGINAVFAFGYGNSWETEELSVESDDIIYTYDEFKKDNETYFDAPFNAEFSIGYAF